MTALADTSTDAASMLRLLSNPPATRLVDHLARLGPLSPGQGGLIGEVERAGLRGRGGAAFPTAIKLAAVRRNTTIRRAVVVANGTEGEPTSEKDKTLLVHAPHLVLDGVVAAALTVGAREGIVCVDRAARPAYDAIERALAERDDNDPVKLRVAGTPDRYVAGEETALVQWLNGADAKPAFTPPRPFEQGVARRPTLVDNVETLAHIAVIARVGGARWADAGTRLVTVGGAVARPGVYEVPPNTTIDAVLRNAGASAPVGVLVGGYFGTWLTPAEAAIAPLDAGIVSVLSANVCPLEELARITTWLASQTAGQCGPCVHGLPAIARAVTHLATKRDRDDGARLAADRWSEMVKGRGACKLPDGAARFVQSGLRVFADHVALHRTRGGCAARGAPPVLPVPRPEASWR